MRSMFLAAACVLAASPAIAADLGGPKPQAPAPAAAPVSPLNGCFVEASADGAFLAAGDRLATASLGGGCDIKVNGIVVGGSLRHVMGDAKAGAFQLRAGLPINPHLLGYGFTEFRAPEWKTSSGQIHLGAGVETTAFHPMFSIFGEASTALSKFGPEATKDDVSVRLGVRIRQ